MVVLILFFFCSLPNIIEEIAKEDVEKEKRRIRQNVTKEERLQSGPPRLGKHKYISKTS
jgi:nucleolar protein 53